MKRLELNVRPAQLSSIAAELDKYNDQIVSEYEATQKQD